MKLKHFAGYGCVNAKKISSTVDTLVVRVWGNHERGLELNDTYDVFNWLVKRFDKTRKDCFEIKSFKMDDGYVSIDGLDTEVCVYTINFLN